jgi:phosphopantothenoylcysteine decarboxylase/phosphopantothenate--cysteine ligase
MADARRILLGVTGGVAAYKAAELTRLLIRNNVSVRVAMTEAGTRFVGTATFQALTGQPVMTSLWDDSVPNAMGHIALSREADAIVIAPASANFIAKLAQGRADDLLSTLCLARDCPMILAPAMNREMWENAATQRNLDQLRADGVTILGPASGEQACGETGMGRMLEPQELLEGILGSFAPRVLEGRKVLVTAGPTFEAIDTVRGITNRSSGKMGYAIAEAAAARGAEVVLISGPTSLADPRISRVVRVTSAAQMWKAVQDNLTGTDLFFAVAAVADYAPATVSARKIKKSASAMTLSLEPTVDILGHVASMPHAPFCVGFAAESENLADYAQAKRAKKKIPMIVANLVQSAVGADENEVTIYDDAGAHAVRKANKAKVAAAVVEHAVRLMPAKRRAAAVRPIRRAS